MKKIILFALLIASLSALGQDSLKLKRIDSMVNAINHTKYNIYTDSLIKEDTATGASVKMHAIIHEDGNELKLYNYKIDIVTKDKGEIKKAVNNYFFYYNKGYLLKVVETVGGEEGEIKFNYYYEDDKAISYPIKSKVTEKRADFLLNMSFTLLELFEEKTKK